MEFEDRPVISSVWIVVLAFVFFPLSIILILIRVLRNWNLSFQKISDIRVSGYILIAIFCVFTGLVFAASESSNTKQDYITIPIVFGIMFLLPAIYFLTLARRKSNKLDSRYGSYYEIIVIRQETSIAAIAQTMKKRPKMVENDLLRMIYLGMLDDGYIDESSNRIVFYEQSEDEDVAIEEYEEEEEEETGNQVKLLPKKVECSGCGSSSMLKPRETVSCTYCGESLVYPA